MEGVVIGSRSIAEHKMQVLNFMDMLYDIAFDGADKGNINPWINNLKYEIKCLQRDNTYGSDVEKHIELLRQKMQDETIKEKDWINLLEYLSELFEIDYTLN